MGRSTVEAFSDLAVKFDVAEARQVREVFAKGITGGICCNKGRLSELLSRAAQLEASVLRELEGKSSADARREFDQALKLLRAALAKPKLPEALRAQGMIAVAASDL